MEIVPTALPDVKLVKCKKHGDQRGFFSETFKQRALREGGIDHDWVQDNHSLSTRSGVVRGLHFQGPPAAQAKLVRVIRGAVFDVAVDIRKGSPTYGRHVALEISADNWSQLYVPPGFAHGFCTLSEETEVLYKVDAEWAPAHEGGMFWNDPALGIDWPVSADAAVLAPRDLAWPMLKDLVSPF